MAGTRINRIEMKGFKSFANKTELIFGEKFNCVLGPNGSGKSNVMDALCFVLGKSSVKEMRAEKAANLIYNGGKLKNPAKEAEVSIFFDNGSRVFPVDDPEIKITRIIRSKEKKKEQGTQGIYKINNKTRTRQQILELLSAAKVNPDGYNIILQGDIVRLVEMPPSQRREIVEEIAGISIYEERKNKALRELGKVEEKLSEAEIIMTERSTYLKELKKDRDQALKFKELDNKIKRNKATLLQHRLDVKKNEVQRSTTSIGGFQEKIAGIQKQIDGFKKDLEKQKQQVEAINKEVEEKGEKQQVALHKEIEQIRIDLAVKKEREAIVQEEIRKLTERNQQLQASIKDLQSKIKEGDASGSQVTKQITQKQQDIARIDANIEKFKKKNKIDEGIDIDRQIEDLDKQAEKLQEEIQELRESQQNLLREKDRVEIQREQIDQKIDRVAGVAKENKAQVNQLKAKKEQFRQISKDLSTATAEDESLAVQLEHARTKLNKQREDLARLETRQAGIKEGISGGFAIQKIMEQKSRIPGIEGTVSELGKVKSSYSLALEVAAGSRIKAVVVKDDQVAAQCIKFLKDHKLGIATFLPINKLRDVMIKPELRKLKGNGIHGLAVDLVTHDNKYHKVFKYVFENTLIVDDISTARRLGIGKYRMATLQGDIVELSGAMQGGYRKRVQGLGFQDSDLTDDVDKAQKLVQELQDTYQALQSRREEIDERITRLRATKAELEGEVIKLEKSLHLDSEDVGADRKQKKVLDDEIKDLESRIATITKEVTLKNKSLAGLKATKQQLRDKINQLKNPALLAELNALEQKKAEIREEIITLQVQQKSSSSEIANVLQPEVDNIQKILKQQDKEQDQFAKELVGIRTWRKDKEAQLKVQEKEESKFYAQFKDLFNKRSALQESMTKLENQIITKEDGIREQEHKANAVNIELAKAKAELSAIEEEFKPYAGVEPFKSKDHDEIKKEIWQFEKMQQDIGAVNLRALEIYENVEKEYQRLTEKKDTLVREREDVLVMINEIDSKKKELFMKSFDVVDEHFQKMFKALSTKGEASLELEDNKDPFAGGLNIKVRLTGKKFLDIRSLSGGEKTLTALAFIFAIQEHEPAPFYVLDEVDAALDKRNSEKLAQLIGNYAHKAQYLMISHNDYVISEADRLYGISMNEHGISKVTTLKL